MIRRFVILIFAAAALSCAHSDVPGRGTSTLDDIRREIQAAEIAGSTERMRAHITEDVVMMAPNMPPVAGADNAMRAMQQLFDAFRFQIEYRSEEVVVDDEWAFDRGTYAQRLTPRHGGGDVVETGKYLWVYRRASDGAWKQARVIWNSNDPAR